MIADRPYVDSAFFANAEPRPVSTVCKKAVFREYTDSTFRTLKPRAPKWEHLGFLGLMIRGVVGDTIRVVFRNNASNPHAVHPHGVFYSKDSEGAVYADGTTGPTRQTMPCRRVGRTPTSGRSPSAPAPDRCRGAR